MTTQLNKIALLTGSLLTLSLLAGAACADTSLATGGYARAFHKMGMMKMIDGDGNHMVTPTEFKEYFGLVFEELDTNADGSLDSKEWVGTKGDQEISLATGGYSRELRSMEMMKKMDKNADHKVSKDEFIGHQQTLLAAMDANKDGQLDPQEWLARQTGNK